MRRPVFLLTLLVLLLSPAAGFGQQPFTIQDLVAMDRVSGPVVSPDLTRIVFTISALDLEANRRRTDLWIVGVDGTGLRRLTNDPATDTSPRWTADGRSVWFLSSRSGSMQVWKVPADGGEAAQVTTLPLDVGSFAVSRDDRMLAVSLDVFPDCGTIDCTTKRLKEREAGKTTGQLFDRLFIRHWDTWSDGRRSHLFAVPAAGGSPVDVMTGMDADSPSKPFGGPEEYTFSPDGKAIVFTARDAGREEPWSTNLDVYVAPIDGSAKPRNLTTANKATDTSPVFSPDGRTLAYRSFARPGYESDKYVVKLRAWPDGAERSLAADWDRSPDEVVWSADGRTIYATAGNLGHTSLFAIDVASGTVRAVLKEGHIAAPAVAGDRIVVALDHFKLPAELHTVRPDGSGLRAITSINAPRLAKITFGDAEQMTFKGWNDETVYAWIVKPVGFNPSAKYPVAFLIHGGPQGSFPNNFHYRWNAQTYAAQGYAAVMVDFHGSTGYGRAFTDSIGGDWGGKPLVDLQKGLDAALMKYPWMDGTRVCALGASYGAYMVNWIAGQWPDRFKCLVSHDGNLDERMAYYATEELWFPEWDHRGTPWDNPEGYTKHNPIDYVKNWKTPMLVVHGGRDYRIPDTQGMAVFTALQRRGIPSQFLYFPDESHWVLKPANSIQWHETVLAWLDRWLKK
jgi:dipeptidyl aminopeptidase/acylaminoacyl peptidase